MPTVRDIKRRKRSVPNTGKVTNAMSLIAASEMRRAQTAVLQGRPYGFLYNEARVLFEWGEMGLRQDPPGGQGAARGAPTGRDRERGMELLDQALAMFQRCAAKKDVEKVLARKELLKAQSNK